MNKQTIRKTLAIAALGLAGVAATGAAHAGNVAWSVGINLPPLVISGGNVGAYYPAPVYYPPPVVYAPPPVVYAPPPRVVYAPPPVIYRPAPPVVYRPAPVRYDPQHGYWRDSRWQGRGDSDRWRDRDRDGVPNKWDRRD
jgi:hypothetical protein